MGHLAEVALGESFADERRAHDHRLGDEQLVEMPDDVREGVVADGPPCEELPHHLAEPDDIATPGQLENVNRRLRLGQGHDADVVVDQLPHGERDVGVGLVFAGRHNHRGLLDADVAVGLGVVGVAHRHRESLVVQTQRLVLVRDEQDVRDRVLSQLVDECAADRVEISDDDMALGILREGARGAGRILRLHPRLVREPDERKRQDDEH